MAVVDAVFVTAFVGGMLTFIAPCFLPLVPGYIGYMTGVEKTQTIKRLVHAISFVLGFTAVFALFGAGVGILGKWLLLNQDAIRIISGALLVLFGVAMLQIFQLPLLFREIHLPFYKPGKKGGNSNFIRSCAVGVVFAFAWTPCTGPVLGSILTLAYNFQDWQRSTLLLAVYALGLGVPFLLSAIFVDTLLRPIKKILLPWGIWIQRFSGVVLILFAIALFTDSFTRFSRFLE